MTTTDSLIARIRGEYREMPGLRLTFTQARRLWQVDGAACHTALEALLKEGFLTLTKDGTFIAAPTESSRLPSSAVSRSRRPA